MVFVSVLNQVPESLSQEVQIGILPSLSKSSTKKPWFLPFCDFFMRDTNEKSNIPRRSGSGAGSVSERYGSDDPDPWPDPYQNVTDPEHWSSSLSSFLLWNSKSLADFFHSQNRLFTVPVPILPAKKHWEKVNKRVCLFCWHLLVFFKLCTGM